MSPLLATFAYAGLLFATALPLVVLLWKRRAATVVAGVYAAFLLSLAGYHSGLFQSSPVAGLDTVDSGAGVISPSQCAELLELLESARVILDRRAPPRLAVARGRWLQLPQEGRDAATTCVERSWPEGTGAAQVDASTE